MTTASFAVDGSPEYRMISYLPATDADAAKIARLKEIGGVQYPAESEPQG
jgi:hypothetical protein